MKRWIIAIMSIAYAVGGQAGMLITSDGAWDSSGVVALSNGGVQTNYNFNGEFGSAAGNDYFSSNANSEETNFMYMAAAPGNPDLTYQAGKTYIYQIQGYAAIAGHSNTQNVMLIAGSDTNGIAGTLVSGLNNTGTYGINDQVAISGSYTVEAGDPVIGQPIGMKLYSSGIQTRWCSDGSSFISSVLTDHISTGTLFSTEFELDGSGELITTGNLVEMEVVAGESLIITNAVDSYFRMNINDLGQKNNFKLDAQADSFRASTFYTLSFRGQKTIENDAAQNEVDIILGGTYTNTLAISTTSTPYSMAINPDEIGLVGNDLSIEFVPAGTATAANQYQVSNIDFSAAAPPPVSTTVVFIQDEEITENDEGIGQVYTGTHDAELRKSNPNTNYDEGTGSSNPEFKVDELGNPGESHAVLRFDDIFDHVSSNAVISGATLFIDIDNQGNDMSLYRLAEGVPAWSETTVTWNSLGSGTNGVGGDTDTTGSATTVPGAGNKVYIDVTADVRAWHQGATNNGWAFLPGGTDGVDFDASENTDSADRPALTLECRDPNAVYFIQDPITAGSATATVAYAGSIANYASDPDSDPLTFSKVGGPLWLDVSTNGVLSGTPSAADAGFSSFDVRVSDDGDGSHIATLHIIVNDQDGNPPPSTEHYRVTWDDDPSSTATIAWEQIFGENGTVYYGTTDFGRSWSNYPSQKTVDSVGSYRNGEILSCFARLTGLQPDTPYYFVIKGDAGVSPRFWFLTAPDTPKPFTFIGGGDSRSNPTPRRKANRMVARLRPLFVVFTGDMISSDNAEKWNEWFGDWQETISSDGRIYPLIPHRGNHESGGNNNFYQLFDTTAENYYAFSVGGTLMRFYVLNSETTEGGDQATWLDGDLTTNAASQTHLCAGYHKPMRPHQSGKSEGNPEYDAWAQLFYDNGMDLVFEADSHTAKRTWPVRPDSGVGSDEGFIRDDTNGTVYTGEGCWGAPLRAADDLKDWTRDAGKFYSFDWVHVYPTYMELYTIKVDNADSVGWLQEGDVFSLPSDVDLWKPSNGTRVIVNNHASASTNSYAQWQLDQWGAGGIPAGTEAMSDYDGDGYNNLTEFAYGLDPQMAAAAGPGVFPVISVDSSDIEVTYRRKPNTSLTYRYEFSSDLITWIPMLEGVDYSLTTVPAGDNEQVTIKLLGPMEPAVQGFIRVSAGIR